MIHAKYKRLLIIVCSTSLLLLIPLIAMQFTPEVKWDIIDFIAAGAILLSLGFGIGFIIRKVRQPNTRIIAVLAILFLFILVWMELAVGIFGSPMAGS